MLMVFPSPATTTRAVRATALALVRKQLERMRDNDNGDIADELHGQAERMNLSAIAKSLEYSSNTGEVEAVRTELEHYINVIEAALTADWLARESDLNDRAVCTEDAGSPTEATRG